LVESITNAYVTNHRSNAAQIGVGGTNVGVFGAIGKYYRARIWNSASFAGSPVFDADFTTGITSGAQTTFTESSANAATVTINRATLGRKSVAVTRPILLFGTDDYLEVADNDLLDFGASDSFTALVVVRQWNTPTSGGRMISKAGTGTITGWHIVNNAATFTPLVAIGDGTNTVGRNPVATTAGTLVPIGILVNRQGNTITGFTGNSIQTTASVSTVGSTANASNIRIGQAATGAGPIDMELVAAAVWRRALNANEIATIVNRYT